LPCCCDGSAGSIPSPLTTHTNQSINPSIDQLNSGSGSSISSSTPIKKTQKERLVSSSLLASPPPTPQQQPPFPAGAEGQAPINDDNDNDKDDTLEAYRAALPPPPPLARATCERLTLAVQHKAGQLAETLQWKGEVKGPLADEPDREKVEQAAGELAASLLRLAEALCVDPGRAMLEKMALNAKKYPAALARARPGKYTAYSSVTGITKTEGQTTEAGGAVRRPPWGREVTLRGVQGRLRVFAAERDWEQYHTPRNILLALLGETGELAETVLDLPYSPASPPPCPSRWDPARRDALAQELADVAIYLCRFSDVCGIDLGAGLRAAARSEWAKQEQQEQQQHMALAERFHAPGGFGGVVKGTGAALTVVAGLALVGALVLGKMLRH
jgi:dCTP diphosphatase